MANSYNTADLVRGTLQACGEVTDGSSPLHELALKYINDVYIAVLSGSNEFDPETASPYTWARTASTVNFNPPYSTGTVTLTNGSATGTFSIAPTTSQTGFFFKANNYKTWYRIASHTASATSFTLDSAWVDVSDTADTFVCVQLIYNLGTKILRLAESLRIYVDRQLEEWEKNSDQGRIYAIDIDQFRTEYPLRNIRQEVPTKFAILSHNESAWNIQINRYPVTTVKADFEYIGIPDDLIDSDSSVPILPREWRKTLMFGASYYLLMDKEEKEKAMNYFQLAKQCINAMQLAESKNDSQTSNTFGVLIPRRDNGYPWAKQW